MKWSTPAATFAASACLLFTSGCAFQYRQSIEKIVGPYQAGLYAEAAGNAEQARMKSEKDGSSRNKLVLLLEEGAADRTAGQLEQSSGALDQADRMFEDYDSKAKVQVGREAVAVITDPANIDYQGYGYDRIMMQVYKTLNYLQQNKPDDAAVEVRRIQTAQEKCEQRYAAKIAQAESAKLSAAQEQQGKSAQASFDLNKARQDPKFAQGEREIFADFPEVQSEQEDLTHKAVYDNPYAHYIQGLFYLQSNVAGDHELGRTFISDAYGMMPKNFYLSQDAKMAEDVSSGRAVGPRTYVFFETGMAPTREEFRIDIPVFIFNVLVHDTRVDYVGLALPKLRKNGGNYETLFANAAGVRYPTQMLADVDKIVAREFKNELPQIITRAVASLLVKVAAEYATAEATKNQDVSVQIISRLAVSGFAALTNEADTRTWRTLPKAVQLASFATPADGVVELSFPNGQPAGRVTVQPTKSNIVWVRSPTITAVPVVAAFPMK